MNIIKKFSALALMSFIAAFSVSFNAMADDPVAGAAQFSANCTGSNCHNTATPLISNAAKIYNARNARAWIQSNINSNNSGMRVLSTMTAQQVADVAAYLGNSPSSLSFASTAVGSTAATQTVTVKASLSNSYPISAMSMSTSGDFARQGGTCGTAVATGLSCTVIVAFTPTAAGARTGSLSIAHAGTLTPVAIALSGTATGGGAPPPTPAPTPAPIASVSPSSLTLASTAIGSTSAAQNVTVSNSGSAGLLISSIAASAEFAVVGGTCSAGGTVAAGSSCLVSVALVPTGAAGARSGALTVAHNAAGSPGIVGLSGTATAAAAPVAAISAALVFGSLNVGSTSTAQTVTLSNTGNAALTLGTLSTGSADFTINGGTCVAGGTVAVAGNCTVNVSFTPTTAGARSANLTITHNAAGLSSSAGLSGTGVALSAVIGLSPTTLSFSQTLNAASAAQTVTVSNTGNAALVLSALSLSGAQASEYQIATGTTCVVGGVTGGSVLANTSCLLKLVFTPTATGARSASLNLTHNASGSPSSIALNGTGTATPQPAISLNAASLTFASQTLGSVSTAQTVTVTNSGAATLTFSGLNLTGMAATDFTRSGTCSATGALAVGGSCTVGFTFTPGAVGLRSATLSMTSDASNGAAALSLSGTGAAVVAPTLLLNLAPSSLAFGNQSTGVTSTSRSAVLSNAGTGSVSLAGITASAGFAVAHNCGSSLAASATCNLNVTYTPTTSGAASGSVSVASNAVGAPHVLGLSGIGVTASPVLAWLPAAASVAFGDISVGGNPASKSLTLTNQGPGAVSLQQFTLAGAQASDFSLSAGSTCAVNSSLAAGASCTMVLAFQPAAVGARSATLQIASSGTNPADVVLSGNGTALAMPSLLLSPLALSFDVTAPATSAVEQTLSLQNNGNAVLRVQSLRVASGAYTVAAAGSNGCPTAPFDLMPAQGCALAVGWSSTLLGSEPGVVEVSTNAAAAPVQVALLGTRQAAAVVPPGGPVPPTTTAPTNAAMSNAGGGGCSIASGHSLADPTLWLLTLLAVGVLMLRRKDH
jgi:trimeric autotransporter adhesin